jgi:hypothetical protein
LESDLFFKSGLVILNPVASFNKDLINPVASFNKDLINPVASFNKWKNKKLFFRGELRKQWDRSIIYLILHCVYIHFKYCFKNIFALWFCSVPVLIFFYHIFICFNEFTSKCVISRFCYDVALKKQNKKISSYSFYICMKKIFYLFYFVKKIKCFNRDNYFIGFFCIFVLIRKNI